MTFKGKVMEDPLLKKREELQTGIQEPAAARAMLEALGLQVCFHYSKFREIHLLVRYGQKLEVCLDQTPVGTFVEIEGPEIEIQQLAKEFGWNRDSFIRKDYVQLYQETERSG